MADITLCNGRPCDVAHAMSARIAALEAQLEAARNEAASKQATIDALMLEYCPDAMSEEQLEEWNRHQAAAEEEIFARIDAALKESENG